MRVKEHSKLVRDRIPEYLHARGIASEIRTLDQPEMVEQLHIKLGEEVREFQESGEIEELADILEIMHAILAARGLSPDDLEQIRSDKYQERGGFEKRLFLVSTSE